MKNLKRQLRLTALSLSTLCLLTGAYGQITPSGDANTNTASPTTNYGAKPLLDVESASQTTYIQFDLSSLPAGYTSANISKATLKLYVNALTTAGSFNVDFVNGAWSEKTITANLSPALGTTIVASVPLTSANVHDYIIIDITSAVGAWLNGTQANDGIALVGNSPFNASFDSKENTTMSHPPELDIVFAGGGTITGVTTASGSGLTGGGTSGTLNLALTNSCSANQVLQWNGSAWGCAAVGMGTVTSVGSGFGLTGGPITGSGTLSINSAVVPQLSAANTFTGNQTVNGNLSATGTVTGSSFQIGSNLFAFGSYSSGNAYLGFAGNSGITGGSNTATGVAALSADTNGGFNTADGAYALAANTGQYNTATGAYALGSSGTGPANTASGFSALEFNTTGAGNTASGADALYSNGTGSFNTATGYQALTANTASGNTADGSQALASNTLGQYNSASGYQALYSNTGDSSGNGSANTASGYQALYSNTIGKNNTGNGYQALYNNTASNNNAAGYQALYSNTTGTENDASGYQALYSNTTASYNNASGYRALYSNSTGFYNSASGHQALYSNSTGSSNTASGYGALNSNTTGWGNSADGSDALYSNATGSYNTANGFGALSSNTTGSYNTALGEGADVGNPNLTNATAIGSRALVSESNALVLGGTGSYAVEVGIGTATPDHVFTIAQNAGHAIADGWDTYSSRRWKTNIHTLHGALGKVEQLRGVSYDLKDSGKHEVGVIAEEVGSVVPEIVSWDKNGKDAQGVDYSRLTALLIEATKEQQALIRQQAEQIRAQQRQIRAERTRGDVQQTEIARLTSQVKGIQLSLKTNSGTDAGVRTASVRAPAVVR